MVRVLGVGNFRVFEGNLVVVGWFVVLVGSGVDWYFECEEENRI